MQEQMKWIVAVMAGMFCLSLSTPVMATAVVTVQNSGTGPKEVLLFQPSHPRAQTLAMVWKMETKNKLGEMEIPMDLPPVEATFSVTSLPQTNEEEAHYSMKVLGVSFKMDESDLPAELLASTEQGMKELVGVVTEGVLLNNGQHRKVDLPSGVEAHSMLEQFGSAMSNSVVVFPKIPVGVGAKWTYTEVIEQNGFRFDRSTDVEIKSIDGSRIEMALSHGGKPLTDSFNAPGLPSGTTAKLASFMLEGKGTLVCDLNELFPVKSVMDIQMLMTLKIKTDGVTEAIDSEIDMASHIDLSSQ